MTKRLYIKGVLIKAKKIRLNNHQKETSSINHGIFIKWNTMQKNKAENNLQTVLRMYNATWAKTKQAAKENASDL